MLNPGGLTEKLALRLQCISLRVGIPLALLLESRQWEESFTVALLIADTEQRRRNMQTSSTERTLTGNALAFEESVDVPAPVAEVYRRWTDFSRFPEFMRNVESVRPLGGAAITGLPVFLAPSRNGMLR